MRNLLLRHATHDARLNLDVWVTALRFGMKVSDMSPQMGALVVGFDMVGAVLAPALTRIHCHLASFRPLVNVAFVAANGGVGHDWWIFSKVAMVRVA